MKQESLNTIEEKEISAFVCKEIQKIEESIKKCVNVLKETDCSNLLRKMSATCLIVGGDTPQSDFSYNFKYCDNSKEIDGEYIREVYEPATDAARGLAYYLKYHDDTHLFFLLAEVLNSYIQETQEPLEDEDEDE